MGPFPFSDCASLRKTKTDYVNESLSHIRSDTEGKKKEKKIYIHIHTYTQPLQTRQSKISKGFSY